MEGIISVEGLLEEVNSISNNSERLILIVYGGPGTGKTTISQKLVDKLNYIHQTGPSTDISNAQCLREIPGRLSDSNSIYVYENKDSDHKRPFASHLKMDGFHLPYNTLTDSQIKRRGSPSTFDAQQVVELFNLLLEKNWDLLSIPDFDHKRKDPVSKSIWLSKRTKVIVFEGLYLMLDETPWDKISKTINSYNDKNTGIKIKIVRVVCDDTKLRVANRHYHSGVVESLEKGIEKYCENDLRNGQLVNEKSNNTLCNYVIDNSRENCYL